MSSVSSHRYPFMLLLILVFSTSAWTVSASDHGEISVTTTKTHLPYQSKNGLITEGQAQSYVDAVITLDRLISLKDADSLPRAPGSRLVVFKRNNTVRVQIPRAIGDLLVNSGVEVTVLREFMLVAGQRSGERQAGPMQTTLAEPCSEFSVKQANTIDLPIPEGSWAFSTITITEAPTDAQVLCLDVYFEIDHSCVSDVEVDLSNEDISIEADLKDESFAFSCAGYYEDTVTGITGFAGEPVNQEWHLWAADWFPFDSGVIDSWWIKLYYTTSGVEPVFVPDEPHQAITLVEGELFEGTTQGATGNHISQCSWEDTQDVWHVFTPQTGGLLVLSTQGSELDTTLSVHDPCSLLELACNDDVGFVCEGEDVWSQIMMPVENGQSYLIRVAGYDGKEGNYQITAELLLDELPDEPNVPVPVDGERDVATNTRLRWNNLLWNPPMSGTQSGSVNSVFSVITPETIYGNDDRVEEYDVTDPNLLTAGEATVLLTYRGWLTHDPNRQTYEITSLETLAEWYTRAYDGYTLCPDEPFQDQPSPGVCTGFLVARDIVATAGHCVACTSDCNDTAFIFDFTMVDEFSPKTIFHESDVYFCREVIGFLDGWPDWALVRLDRTVDHVDPIPLRRTGKVSDRQSLMMVGHPFGLPKKYDMGGTVGENEDLVFFEANVDASAGSSGSAVFNLDTLAVEGILVAGLGDFDFGDKCDRSLALPDDFSTSASITRATAFSRLIPSYDIYLGTQPDQLAQVAENVAASYWAVNDLQKNTRYYWQIVARTIVGNTQSPVWTFRTEP